jgi:hypothetical protein
MAKGGPVQGVEPTPVQAADLIGQLGDPLCLRKANALYYEFDERSMIGSSDIHSQRI